MFYSTFFKFSDSISFCFDLSLLSESSFNTFFKTIKSTIITTKTKTTIGQFLVTYDFMSFLGEIEDEFDVEIDEREAVKITTVGEAAAYIESISE